MSDNVRWSLSQPFVRRAVVYAVSFIITAVAGTFGWMSMEQAQSLEDALPSLIASLSGMVPPILALFNLHRGSDSTATGADVEKAQQAIPTDAIGVIVDAVQSGVVTELTNRWDTTGAHSASPSPAEMVADNIYPGGTSAPGTYPS